MAINTLDTKKRHTTRRGEHEVMFAYRPWGRYVLDRHFLANFRNFGQNKMSPMPYYGLLSLPMSGYSFGKTSLADGWEA